MFCSDQNFPDRQHREVPVTLRFFLLITVLLYSTTAALASEGWKVKHKNAIVLAMFGTTVESALEGLLNIRSKMISKYPETPVKIAFTSNIIRKKWQQRAEDPTYSKAHPQIPEDVLHVKTVLATIADLQNDGYDTIVLQPTHIAMGEEFLDLGTYVESLMNLGTIKKKKYKPFHKVVLGRPALGTYGVDFPYAEDITVAAKALATDAEMAAKEEAALVYMGHGNEHFPSGGAYLELADRMRKLYPKVTTLIGNVEGFPSLEDLIDKLKLRNIKKVILKPCMIVAGDHAMNDMAGTDPKEPSWQMILEKQGFEVIAVKKGLGELNSFADIFVQHAADAAADAGIMLK
ncbi:sirohydrochlorin cobaltochelatase [Desulfobulbus sp. TB]|nr:sirohydrochlorin cobaltochelatase [Desulfobulbus sp. TB]